MGPEGMAVTDLETLTQQYGRRLFARLEDDRPVPLGSQWWDERLMSWGMDAEPLKMQMFRFIDVLPMLRDQRQINGHLCEYLGEAAKDLAPAFEKAVHWMPQDGFLGRWLAWAATRGVERMARRFIAGSNLAEALDAIAQLRRHRLGFTIDLLGEAVLTEREADLYYEQYLNLITGLSGAVNAWPEVPLIDRDHRGPIPRVNVSLKLSSLYSQFDPIDPDGTSVAVKQRLRPILRRARQLHAFVNIDMEQYAYKDLTLRIFQEVLLEDEFRRWSDVGIALQAYLQDCGKDLRCLCDWAERRGTPVWVRLVKGAYWDYEIVISAQNDWPTPVFTRKWQSDACFEEQTRFLMEHHELLQPAIGSHNVRSIAHALAAAEYFNVPPRSYEFQLLYGMADPIKAALVASGQRVRVYTPYGHLLPGMAYLVRRLLENTANQSFLRASFIEHVDEEKLLMQPTATLSHESALQDGSAAVPGRAHESKETRFHNEPITDFSRADARAAMRAALAQVRKAFGQTYPLIVGGRPVVTEATLTSVNPSRSAEIVGICAQANAEQAAAAVATAVETFPAWRDRDVPDRVEYLVRAAEIIRERRFELAAWQVYECGKPWREADADVAEAIDYCRFYAQEMVRLATPRRRDVPGEDNEYFYEPRGVCVVIAPWNFPLAILCGMTTAALAAGNTVVMKPAEQSSVVAAKLMEVFQQAGFPEGVVNYLPGIGEEIGPTLVQHPDVSLIAFTGSRAVGLAINQEAAVTAPDQSHVKRVITEMGGKNAIIVDNDADLDEAVHGVVVSAFGYAGQKCSACSRAIILDDIHDAFLARLIEATKSLRIGPAEEPGSFVGPVIDEQARERILDYIEQGKKEARLAYAADVSHLAEMGYYVGPHIFAEVAPTAVIAQEEIFGPVLAVIRARDLDHALDIANGTSYALTGGVFSRSPGRIARVRRDFRVGNLYINRKITGALVDRQPFGGFKLSGIGSKAGGPDYLLQFLIPRTITENTMRHGFAPLATFVPNT